MYVFGIAFAFDLPKQYITMKKIYIAITSLLLTSVGLQAEGQDYIVRLTLKEAINLAQT